MKFHWWEAPLWIVAGIFMAYALMGGHPPWG
jgi:hypothetical protein